MCLDNKNQDLSSIYTWVNVYTHHTGFIPLGEPGHRCPLCTHCCAAYLLVLEAEAMAAPMMLPECALRAATMPPVEAAAISVSKRSILSGFEPACQKAQREKEAPDRVAGRWGGQMTSS